MTILFPISDESFQIRWRPSNFSILLTNFANYTYVFCHFTLLNGRSPDQSCQQMILNLKLYTNLLYSRVARENLERVVGKIEKFESFKLENLSNLSIFPTALFNFSHTTKDDKGLYIIDNFWWLVAYYS